jgi:hypothetical protein
MNGNENSSKNSREGRITMMNRFFVALACTVMVSPLAQAAKKNFEMPAVDSAPSKEASTSMTEVEFQKFLKTFKVTKRAPADADAYTEGEMSASTKVIRDGLLNAKTAKDLDILLVKLEAAYPTMDVAGKYFAAQILPLKNMRGIVWRLRPLVETKGVSGAFSGNRATHSAAVTMLRETAAGIDAYLPTDQWRAGFDYVTQPSEEMTTADQFKFVHDLQAFTIAIVIPALKTASLRINDDVLPKMDTTTNFVWDNKVAYGTGSMDDGVKRFVGHGRIEAMASRVMIMNSIHAAYVGSAYNHDSLPQVVSAMGQLYGIDGFLPKAELGVTAEQRQRVFNSFLSADRSKGFLSIHPNGRGYMVKALEFARASVAESALIAKALQDLPANSNKGLNPLLFQSSAQPFLMTGADRLNELMKVDQAGEVRSGLTGKSVRVNISAFYTNPPMNLAYLMPNDWDHTGKPEPTITSKKSGETLSFRNYYRGRPISWDNSQWSKYVPSASGASSDYMNEANRTLRSALGTNYGWAAMGSYFL